MNTQLNTQSASLNDSQQSSLAFILDHAKNKYDYLPGLTGLRGVAALLVYFFHVSALTITHKPIEPIAIFVHGGGFEGVLLFFALSGFLLSLPFIDWVLGARSCPKLKNYFKRRILRIFPAFYFQLIILVLLAVFVQSQEFNWKRVLVNLSMQFNGPPLNIDPYVGTWWTLPIEFSFYLFLPVLAWFFIKTNVWVFILVTTVATVLARYYFFNYTDTQPIVIRVDRFLGCLALFTSGTVTAYFYRKTSHINHSNGLLLTVGGLGLLWCYASLRWLEWSAISDRYYKGAWELFFLGSVNVVGLCLIIYAVACSNTILNKIFANRCLVGFGTLSYSFYLWHLPVLEYLDRKWQIDNFVYLFVAGFLIATTLSMLSYRFIEYPWISKNK